MRTQLLRAIVRERELPENMVVGITADADVYHVECAIFLYGKSAIDTVCMNERDGISDIEATNAGIMARILADEWPLDGEGNGIRAVITGRDDSLIYGEDMGNSAPASCGMSGCHRTIAHHLSNEQLRAVETAIRDIIS